MPTLIDYVGQMGSLLPLDFSKIPFEPKRLFVVQSVPRDTERGGHGHYQCKQLFICLRGRIWLEFTKDGVTDTTTLGPRDVFFLDIGVFCKQRYLSGDDILLVLCSHPYDKDDYFYNPL